MGAIGRKKQKGGNDIINNLTQLLKIILKTYFVCVCVTVVYVYVCVLIHTCVEWVRKHVCAHEKSSMPPHNIF